MAVTPANKIVRGKDLTTVGTEIKSALAGKQDTIADLSAIRSGAALGSTSVQPVDIEDMVEAEPIGSIVPPVNPSEFATKEELSQLEAKVTDLDGVVNGASNPPQDVTPTTQPGYYYWNRNYVLAPDANGGSYYSGTISDNVISGGIDVSAYVGRTLKVTVSGYGATSQRLTAITDENNGILASVQESGYVADGTDYSATLQIPEGAKYFYWSGVGTLVSVILSAGERQPGLADEVHSLADEVHSNTAKLGNFTIIPSDTTNLINPTDVILGYVYGSNGIYAYSENYYATEKIPVTAGTTYKVLCISQFAGAEMYRHVCFYDEDGETVVAGGITSPSSSPFTAPTDAHFAIVSLFRKPNGVIIEPEEYGLFIGTNPSFVPWYGNKVEIPYVPLGNKTDDSVLTKKDLESISLVGSSLKVVVESPKVIISEGSNSIEITKNYEQSRETDAGQNEYDNNAVFDFYTMTYNGVTTSAMKDDVAPAHFLGQTLGANHGQPCKKATITGHGLTNMAIGTAWVQNNVNFYVMRIVDENNIILLSENRGTSESPSWTSVTTGTITDGVTTLTISAVADAQLYPSIKNRTIKLLLDGNEISSDGTYNGNVLDIVENYEIMNPASVLANIIARAGTSADPVYAGDGAAKVENIYRFVKGLTVLVISNFIPLASVAFQDVMFSQAERKGSNGVTKYYIPNSLPFDGNDLSQPTAMTWSSSVSDIYCNQEHSVDPTKPINRVIQYNGGCGFAIGFLLDRGVGKNLYDYANNTFEVRGNGGKVYPHGVERAKVGTTLQNGQAYNSVIYRSLFVPETTGNRISLYHFNFDDAEYVFLDYKGNMNDHVVLDDSLNGKEIEVLEAQNATLKTDVYNGGFYVSAVFVSNETCYLIAKIK